MYIYMHIYIYIYIYIYIHIYIYLYINYNKKVLASAIVVINWYFFRSYFIFMELNLNYSVMGSQGLNFYIESGINVCSFTKTADMGYSKKPNQMY